MIPTQRHIVALAAFWLWAAVMTWMDHRIGPDADTYDLLGVAAGATIAYAALRVVQWRDNRQKEASA